MLTFREKLFAILEMRETVVSGRWVGSAIMLLIVVNVTTIILETVPEIDHEWHRVFSIIDVLAVAIFSAEYFMRVWSCTSDEEYKHPVMGRIKFMLTPMALIDLISIAPFFLPMLINVNLRFLRILRLMRIFRLFKIQTFSNAIGTMGAVIRNKWGEISTCLIVLALILVVSASIMFAIEHHAQPDKFASIPDAMWWSIATLATIGYGDVFPVTPWGKMVAAILAVTGIGIFALLPGILATGFMEELQKKQKPKSCPHCGKELA